jgi:hypothetical protein
MRRIFKYIPILIVVELLICLLGAIPVQAASITLSTNSGTYGTTVTVSGSAYVAGENVTINFGTVGSNPVASFTTTGVTWSQSFTVPSARYGSHVITAVSTGASGTVPGPAFTVTPVITSSAASGNMGAPLTVAGYGFRSIETGVMVTVGGSVVTTTSPSVDADGFWSTTFNIPSATVGSVVIDAYGSQTAIGNVPDLSFTVISVSNIAIGVSSGKVGTSITVNGNGFAANETGITVTFRGNAVGATTTASASGSWSVAFAIPAAPAGSHPIDAYGATTTAATVPDLSFTVIPSFSLNKNTGASGAPVTATGTGFAASETGITITYDGTPVGSTTANSSGGWSINFNVPSLPSGNHTVSAYGSTTAANTSTDITFTTSSGISINKTSGAAGTQVTVTGSGFAANETGITVTYDGNAVGNPVTANPSGSWTLNFTIPPSSGGSHAIDASGSVTSATTITDLSFSIATSLSVSSTGGRVGDAVTVRGTGFSANETNIVVTYDGNPVSQSTSANASGDWSTTFTVPPSSAGSHAIAAKGSATTASVSGGSFNIDPFASISPASGNIGSSATLSGSGFTANSDLQLTFDGNLLTTDKVTSDVTGSFSKSIMIPKSTSGSHAIKVKYGGNKEYGLTFSIGSIDLTLPRIISPTDGESVSLIGDATPNFKWSPISSPNGGITYILQIDTDPEFPAPILQKTNIPSAQYTLTKSEALPNGQYYWRVRAVDAASNQSDWTHPAILQSGVMSPTLFIIVIVIAVIIIVLLLIFFLFRPMQKKKRALEAAARQPAPSISPEIVIPEVINAEYRTVDSEEPGKRKALPWRLALPQAPQAPKGSKTLSSEDQARLKCIIDFAKSLPLLEPGNNTNWLVDIAENTTGSNASPALYEQVLKGEIQLRYEPAWTRHPTFMDLQVLLEGQVLLQDLNSYIDAVNHTATEALRMLQDIYRDIAGAVTWDILEKGGWDFVSAVYTDALSWFMGKHLREPSERDYSIKSDKQAGVDTNTFGLYGEPNTPFARLLVWHTDDKEVMQLRTLHLKLRRNYRNNDKARDVVSIITQLDVQRGRLLSAFSQFNRLNP